MDDHAGWAVMPFSELRLVAPDLTLRLGWEATDVTVAQPVVDEREEMTGGSDAAAVVPSSSADAGLDGGDGAVSGGAGDRFDRRPAQQA